MDGIFNNRRLFVAPRNGAVLVSGDRLRDPRNVSILDGDPTFSAYVCTPPQHQYRDDFSFSRGLPATSSCNEIVSRPSQNGSVVAPSRPHVRNVPIQIVPAARSQLRIRPSVSNPHPRATSTLGRFPVDATDARLKSNEGGLMDGDRIVWFDAEGIPRRGTVRWCGYLRGHTKVYVGVDFVSSFFTLSLYRTVVAGKEKKN
ncbi:unnamed protein product [Gongylonema pulchrum]|uniref:CAP-Gly domain-containing protein n=1 Tax=Gongylonema pulchrum TaxID=637853 RepID=A0A183EFU9_9BILA|nr:unnamed protein product [Gongylonema pulchrum]